jgi:ParB-like chromosome segregation protein Spo0J
MRKKVNIKDIIPNKENPRFISDNKFEKLVQSIKDFPEMLEKRPLVVDENMVVLGGNMRLKALQKAGLKKITIDIAEGWSEEQKKEFIIKDNVGFGEWDWDVLANVWDIESLREWGLDVPKFDTDIDDNDLSDKLKHSYKIEIECSDELEQEEFYNKLTQEGYICKILTL